MLIRRYLGIGRRFTAEAFFRAGLYNKLYQKGTKPVSLGELISPLRYDILIRMNYIEFYRSHVDLFHSNFSGYLELARTTPYFVWFRDVACFTFRPRLLSNKAALDKAFAQRLHGVARLLESFEKRGLDSAASFKLYPITLQAAKRVLPTDSGMMIHREFYAGDGCHRLALLLLSGCRVLQPAFYRVILRNEMRPFDNTSILLRSLPIGESEYAAFLSLGYADESFANLESLQRNVQEKRPEAVKELKRVLELNIPNLTAQ